MNNINLSRKELHQIAIITNISRMSYPSRQESILAQVNSHEKILIMTRTTRTLILLLAILFAHPIYACTVVINSNDDRAVIVGRNMDWMTNMPSHWLIYPAGILRDGKSPDNPIKWTSKYGSVVTTSYSIATDGINEKGLSAHLLWLDASDYGHRDTSQSGLSVILWAQYYLDNFQSVDEAIKFTRSIPFQIIPYFHSTSYRWLKLHMAIEDASGDSAIIEYVNGTPHVYHDRTNTVMTNDPAYDQQLLNIKQYKVFGGDKPLPGTMSSRDRFVRAMYFNSILTKSTSLQHEIHQELSVLQNVSQPYVMSTEQNPRGSWTLWHTISDLTNKTYYYQSTLGLNLLLVDLMKFDLKPGAATMSLSLDEDPNLQGDVSSKFVPVNNAPMMAVAHR